MREENMQNIYAMTPINKTAAIVTGQAGCSDTLTNEQIRDNLVAKVKSLTAEQNLHPKGSKRRKEIGKEISILNMDIHNIRPKKSCRGVEFFFIDVVRESFSAFEFNRMMGIAAKRLESAKILGMIDC